MEKEYFEYCPKSKSNNIIFCPQPNNQEKNDKKVWWINDYFNNIYEEKNQKITEKFNGSKMTSKNLKSKKKKANERKSLKLTNLVKNDKIDAIKDKVHETEDKIKDIKDTVDNIKDKMNNNNNNIDNNKLQSRR